MNNAEIIQFTSRKGDKYSLTKLNENLYKANLGEYLRYGYSDKNCTEISFVDPNGGPFIGVNRVFPYNGRVVKRIISNKDGTLIEFENDN